MRRGDVVTVALQGDLGKPRPALIVQSDMFLAHPTLMIAPITSYLIEDAAPLRPIVQPSAANGLRVVSQVMADRVLSVARPKMGERIGTIEFATMQEVERALAALLELD